jgi:hypothetical protein
MKYPLEAQIATQNSCGGIFLILGVFSLRSTENFPRACYWMLFFWEILVVSCFEPMADCGNNLFYHFQKVQQIAERKALPWISHYRHSSFFTAF